MPTATEAARTLAKRIRDLRKRRWPERTITQRQLASALGGLSVSLISSWEREADPSVPPEDRIGALATFYSTERSLEGGEFRLVDERELSATEAAERERLLQELLALREAATTPESRQFENAEDSIVGRGPWHFADGGKVTIVCSELPQDIQEALPLADEADPDGTELARFADLDSLFELHGHIRAVNPDLEVQYRSAGRIRRDDLRGHLVLLGGVDWNEVTANTMRLIGAPVRQHSGSDPDRGWFEVEEDSGETKRYAPQYLEREGGRTIVQDVAHFLRAPNPLNPQSTLTVSNGMYGVGVFGAVRALTDKGVREQNAAFLEKQFSGRPTFSLVFRVHVVAGEVATPSWQAPDVVLHTWSEV